MKQGYDLDDVLLIPTNSSVCSRDAVSLATIIGNKFYLKIPIIASPMSGIVGVTLIKELGRLGGIGILHRFYNDAIQRQHDLEALEENATNFGVAVGLNDPFYKEACYSGASIICIDVANGYLKSVLDFTQEVAAHIENNKYNCLVMAGNVATYDGAEALYNCGAQLIRTGIGSGTLCTTRNNTGIGVPQATAILDSSHKMCYNTTTYVTSPEQAEPYYSKYAYQSDEHADWKVVADGGIKTSGDGVKALALGADFLMLGTLFSRCFESDHNGHIEGMASREFQEQFYGEVKKSVEGVQQSAIKNISLEALLTEFCWNMKSAFTYCNSTNIAELHSNAGFILCGSNSIVQKG